MDTPASITPNAILQAAELLEQRRARGPAEPGLTQAWVAVLAEVPLFASLSKRNLRRVARLASAARFRRGAMIVTRGAPGDAFYVILDGEVEVQREAGPPIRLGRGDFFGELALLDRKPRSAAIRAVSDVTAMRLRRAPFMKMLRDEPAIAVVLLEELAARIRRADAVAAG